MQKLTKSELKALRRLEKGGIEIGRYFSLHNRPHTAACKSLADKGLVHIHYCRSGIHTATLKVEE